MFLISSVNFNPSNDISKEFSKNALAIHRIDIYKLVENENGNYIEPFINNDPDKRFYLNV